MIAFYGSRLSEHMIRTPEGYLICKDVPIARTGTQEYRGSEFGGADSEKIYKVARPEEEVFDKKALASFEGKPVLDEHPEEDINAKNITRYIKGTARNVHRGDDDLSDFVIADLIVYDEALISEIENGKREISCGYDCLWVPEGDDGYTQKEIRGNHIAVVGRGRAGHQVSIRDSKGKGTNMEKRKGLLGRMLAAFAKDADTSPEDLENASKFIAGQGKEEEQPEPARVETKDDERVTALEAEIAELKKQLAALASKETKDDDEKEEPKEEPTALDDLENELKEKSGKDDEEEVTVPPEKINEAHGETEDDDEEEVIEADDEDDGAKEREAILRVIEAVKPLMAQLPSEQRKEAADSMAKMLRMGAKDSQYKVLARAQKNGHKANDANPMMDDVMYGKLIRDKYNPHYSKKS